MKTQWFASGILSLVLVSVVGTPTAGQVDEALTTAEGVVAELYDLVTFDPGTTPDWDRARSLFLPEAVVVIRSSRDSNSVFSVDGWVGDFVHFITEQNVEARGFIERIVTMKTVVFKDVAHIFVVFEAGFPDSERFPRGVDSIQLVKRRGRWWIASILNEWPDRNNPIPAEVQP